MLSEITMNVDRSTTPSESNASRVDRWQDLTRLIRAGDPESLEIYYEEFFEVMFREARRVTGKDESTILDIVQDAMLKAIRCMRPLSDANAVTAWTKTVAKSAAYDWLRKQARQNLLIEKIKGQPSDPSFEPTLAHEELARLKWLEQQLLDLPADLQQLISFRYRLGWSLKKIAVKMGLKTGAVDGKLRRALEKLKEKAQREYENE